MALYPAAVHRLIPPGSSDPKITPRIAILHVDAGNADSLYGFFLERSGGIESHFHVKRDGTVEQYRDTAYQADANYQANDFAISIETQGYGDGVWTGAQIAAIKKLLMWCQATHGIPLKKCAEWTGTGVGYHSQFPQWSPVVKSCPGPRRILQFNATLVNWMAKENRPKPVPPPKPEKSVKFRVAFVNIFSANKAKVFGIVQLIKAIKLSGWRRPDSIGVAEGEGLGLVPGYQKCVYRQDGRAGREIPILLRKKHTVIGVEYAHAADGKEDADGPAKWDRGIWIVKYKKGKAKVAHLNTHFGFEDSENAKHRRLLVEKVRVLQAQGFLVFVTADANSAAADLTKALRDLGLKVLRRGVCLIAHDKRLVSLMDKRVFDRSVVGADDHSPLAVRVVDLP